VRPHWCHCSTPAEQVQHVLGGWSATGSCRMARCKLQYAAAAGGEAEHVAKHIKCRQDCTVLLLCSCRNWLQADGLASSYAHPCINAKVQAGIHLQDISQKQFFHKCAAFTLVSVAHARWTRNACRRLVMTLLLHSATAWAAMLCCTC
jgi:hypothetical protein